MTQCPVCLKEFNQYTGRRPKRFCSEECKVKYFNAEKKIAKTLTDPKVKDAMKESIRNLVDFGQTAVHIPSMTVGISKDDVEQKLSPPKTLDELKALCPKELTGFDRSTWISQKRQEYGI